tara:strand:- start:14985 stop:16211 length:1227 start_codon:yes stop_codon:yes gene_type:complete
MRFLAFFIFLFYSALGFAQCFGPQIRAINLPLIYGKPDTSVYMYKRVQGTNPTYPTVIVLPGGPGQSSIQQSGFFPMGAIPKEYSRILTDPRGAGCNSNFKNVFSYNTQTLAADILQIIKTENLQNYIIYGASYGTYLATVTASHVEKTRLPAPKAVVLEGVIGKSFDGFAPYMLAFSNEWERVKRSLPGNWPQRLSKTGKLPLGYSSEQWGMFISSQLILGDIPTPPVSGHILNYLLKILDRYEDLKAKNQLDQLTSQEVASLKYINSQMAIGTSSLLFRSIACNELWGSWQEGRLLTEGKLFSYGNNVCSLRMYQKYDSRAYQIKAPVYYFQGPFDPATPVAGAQYHFSNQLATKKTFVLVESASHAPLTAGLSTCAPSVWSAISGLTSVGNAFRKCPRKVKVVVK